jgi:hypothetical protein
MADPTSRRGGARHRKKNINSQIVTNIWSWAPDGARHQDRLTDWPSVVIHSLTHSLTHSLVSWGGIQTSADHNRKTTTWSCEQYRGLAKTEPTTYFTLPGMWPRWHNGISSNRCPGACECMMTHSWTQNSAEGHVISGVGWSLGYLPPMRPLTGSIRGLLT